MSIRCLVVSLVAAGLLVSPAESRAQMGEWNSVMTVGAGTVVGTAVGLLVGFVLAEAVDSSGTSAIDDWSYVKWPYVTGTYLGCLAAMGYAATEPLMSYDPQQREPATKVIAMSAFLGGATGSLLSIATAIAVPDMDFGEGWDLYLLSTLAGTGAGIVMGIYQVSSRSLGNSAFVDIQRGRGTLIGTPLPRIAVEPDRSLALRLALLSASF